MSFYFSLETSEAFPTIAVQDALRGRTVAWVGDEPGNKVFFEAGKSLRGVCIYPADDRIDIGLNAFTTRDDARLARDITAAAAIALACPVLPESEDTPLAADVVHAFCDENWVEDRYKEASIMTNMMTEQPADEPMKIAGYRRGFAFTYAQIAAMQNDGMSSDDVIAKLMQDGMTLQELDQVEDVFAATPMSISAPVEKQKRGLFGLKTIKETETFAAFSLGPGVRTLTPVFMSNDPVFAIMGNEEYGYKRVPYEKIADYAHKTDAREYGWGSFDLTIDGDAYNDLYWQGEAM